MEGEERKLNLLYRCYASINKDTVIIGILRVVK